MPAGCVGRGEVRGCGLGGACTALGSHGEPWILLAVALRGCKGAHGRGSWGSSRARGKKRSVGGPRRRVHSAAAAVGSFSSGSSADRLPRGRGLRGSVRGAAHFSPRLSRSGAGEHPRGAGLQEPAANQIASLGPTPPSIGRLGLRGGTLSRGRGRARPGRRGAEAAPRRPRAALGPSSGPSACSLACSVGLGRRRSWAPPQSWVLDLVGEVACWVESEQPDVEPRISQTLPWAGLGGLLQGLSEPTLG